MKTAKGFSLVELIIVVGVVGAIAAIAVPSMSSYINRSQQREQMATFRSAVVQARNLARSRKECVRVTLTDSTHTISAYSYAPDTSMECSATTPVPIVTLPNVVLLSTMHMSQFTQGTLNVDYIDFNPYGGLSSGVVQTMQLTGASGTSAKEFTIFPGIGQARFNN